MASAGNFLLLVSMLLAVRCLSKDLQGPTLYPATNHTYLKEYLMGTNHSFSCSVNDSSANDTDLSINIPHAAHNNTNIVRSADGSSIQVLITHATSRANNGFYTCNATTELGSSYLSYWVFVGGPPNGASANATITSDNSLINISVIFTDNSSVPVTQVWFTIPNIPGSTYFQKITNPLRGEQVTLPTLTVNASNSSEGQYTLQVYARNQIGSVSILNQTVHIHDVHHESLLIAAVVGGALVIAVAAVVIAGTISSLYCIKKTKRNNELYGNDDAFNNEEEEALQELIPKRAH